MLNDANLSERELEPVGEAVGQDEPALAKRRRQYLARGDLLARRSGIDTTGAGVAPSALRVFSFSAASTPGMMLCEEWGMPGAAVGIYGAIEKLFVSSRIRDQRAAERLTRLYRDALAEDDVIDVASAHQFADFILSHAELTLPKITLSQNGNVRARWIRNDRDYFAIEYFGTSLIKLIMAAPRGDLDMAIVAGMETIDHAITTARSFGVTAA